MMRRLTFLVLIVLAAWPAVAHEVRPALLNISEVSEGHYLVRWKVPAMGDMRIAIDPVFEVACAPDENVVDAFAGGAALRSWNIDCPEGIEGTAIGFSNLSATMIDVLVQVSFLDGRYHSHLVRPNDPIYVVPERNSGSSVATNYVVLGVEHIWTGWDHLLFVLGIVLLVTNRVRLLWAITGFTVAHSITLALAALDLIRVPGPPVEAIIALSIVLLAVETLKQRREDAEETLAVRSPWLISMAIGLVHGLGFAGALSDYGLPGNARALALFAFNVGVEIGQLLFVATLFVGLALLRRADERVLPPVQMAASWFIGLCGSFWLMQRVTGFF